MKAKNQADFDSYIKHMGDDVPETCEHPRCPECGEIEISHAHYDGDAAVPETDFLICTNCGHQWGFE